jgi:hypothetical protein
MSIFRLILSTAPKLLDITKRARRLDMTNAANGVGVSPATTLGSHNLPLPSGGAIKR